jgi:hypothetical protein
MQSPLSTISNTSTSKLLNGLRDVTRWAPSRFWKDAERISRTDLFALDTRTSYSRQRSLIAGASGQTANVAGGRSHACSPNTNIPLCSYCPLLGDKKHSANPAVGGLSNLLIMDARRQQS